MLIVLPEISFHARTRTCNGEMAIKGWTPHSISHLRVRKLSTTVTSWPFPEKYIAVGQPRYPSPPNMRTLFPILIYLLLIADIIALTAEKLISPHFQQHPADCIK